MTGEADVHESLHAQRVLQRLRERISAAGGWLPFDQYMQVALYEPGLGYYSAGARKFGAGGDFTTAPETSPLFGHCLARQCAEVLQTLDGGEIVELGAGTGRLAVDLLNELEARGQLPRSYQILEVSAELRKRQHALIGTLPENLASRVEWLDAPPEEGWHGVLLANEVLDALPCECFTWRDGRIFERGVAPDTHGALSWSERPAPPALHREVERLRAESGSPWPDVYSSELCTRVVPWIAEVTRALAQGVALFVDYGLTRREYYHSERASGTLRVLHRQRAHEDPFLLPGLSDITAWVDFTRVAEAADACGLEVAGFATQAALLLALGIEAEVSAAPDERTRLQRAGEARRLMMPGEMGESFKAIALTRDYTAPLSGLALQDLRERL